MIKGALMDSGNFKNVIQNILNRWSGLKLSVEHQTGGRHSKEKALYLVDYLHEVLLSNNKVEQEDLEDLISEYMDRELETILEDNSVAEISSAILRFYDMFQSGNEALIIQEINKMPFCQTWLDVTIPVSKKQVQQENSDTSSESETEETNQNQSEEMDCEWTEVTYRKKR